MDTNENKTGLRQSDLRLVPANFGPMKQADGNEKFKGPCGDTMEFWIKVDNDKVTSCSFVTDGCETSVYCGSAVAEDVVGKELSVINGYSESDFDYILSEMEIDETDCIKLALLTLQKTVSVYMNKHCSSSCGSCTAANCPSRVKAGQKSRSGASDKGGAAQVSHTDDESHHSKGGASDGKEHSGNEALEDGSTNSSDGAENYSETVACEHIRKNIVVLSGKGGVGKSTVSVNLAVSLAEAGYKTGLVDIDFHGPSIPVMLGVKPNAVEMDGGKIKPFVRGNLKVISIGFLLADSDAPVIWRGPMKMGAIKQFLNDVDWGELDYLVVDCPPGTGDEPLSICQALPDNKCALIVTTPQEVAAADVRRSVNFCRRMELPVVGIVENMSGFACPHCNEVTNIFSTGGGQTISESYDVPFLGTLPISAEVGLACDDGKPFVEGAESSAVMKAFEEIAAKVTDRFPSS